jgi:drug/metabolite transporter (DMT)-like permease
MLRSIAQRTIFGALVGLASVVLFAGTGYAGRGHRDPSCSASPNPAAVGQAFTLSAVGLPTTDPVYLIVQSPSGASSVGAISWLGSGGSWTGSETANEPGVWTYTFSGLMQNKKYGAVATCTEQVN